MAAALSALFTVPATAALASGCNAGACVTINAADEVGPVTHTGAGLLNGVQAGVNMDLLAIRQLGTTMYRSTPARSGNGSYDWSDWDVATAWGAQTTLVLSGLWDETVPYGFPPTPWSNWAAYSAWVKSTVRSILAGGHKVTYWEVQNEPGRAGRYSPAQFRTVTRADVLKQFLVAYQAIKSVDPSAAVVGPSVAEFALKPFPESSITHEPDLGTFLRFVAAHHIHLAAIEWHDDAALPGSIAYEIQSARRFVRTIPSLGHPLIFVNEFGAPWDDTVPGYDVGFLAVLNAGADLADRDCEPTDCFTPQLDGLLTPDGMSTTSDYQARLTYAQMNGEMVWTRSSTSTVPLLASINPAKNTVIGLIGRAVGCVTTAWCRSHWRDGGRPAGPTSVRVSVIVPWTSATRVALSYEAFEPGVSVTSATPATPSNLSIRPYGSGRQLVTFTIPQFADGSAYNLTLSANGLP